MAKMHEEDDSTETVQDGSLQLLEMPAEHSAPVERTTLESVGDPSLFRWPQQFRDVRR